MLGIPHLAVATRDVALYMPFRAALAADHAVGLQTLVWHLMARRIQEQAINPVRPPAATLHYSNTDDSPQLENARAAMDLYRSAAPDWEAQVNRGNWPCALPPGSFSRCYL